MRVEIINDNDFIAYITKKFISYDNDLEEFIKIVFCKYVIIIVSYLIGG